MISMATVVQRSSVDELAAGQHDARMRGRSRRRDVERNVELVGHGLQERQRWQAGLGTQLVEPDDRVVVEHQITAHVVLEAPGQRRLALLRVPSEILEERPILGGRHIAVPVPAEAIQLSGVRPWAIDPSAAERLWSLSEAWTGVPFAPA
jgi:hypothetical protein